MLFKGVATSAYTHLYDVLLEAYMVGSDDLYWSPETGGKFRGDTYSNTTGGYYHTIPVASPAVGAEIVITVPNNTIYRILALTFRFTTAAVVATRRVTLQLDDGTNIIGRNPATSDTQLISTIYDYYSPGGYAGIAVTGAASKIVGIAQPQANVFVPAGYRLQTKTDAIDPGDQYSNVFIYVHEFFFSQG